jgi:hypothetical protein
VFLAREGVPDLHHVVDDVRDGVPANLPVAAVSGRSRR